MKIIKCDACGKEMSRGREVGIPCHLYSQRGRLGHIDADFNRVSGRDDVVDLCNSCVNRVYSAMVDEIEIIKTTVKDI